MNTSAATIMMPTLGNHSDWRVGSGAGSKRHYHIVRHPSDAGGESLCGTNGRPLRFATIEAAIRAAVRANATL